ncbi:MAG: murein biosynthesis integral membrane protein MurJ [Candidatus Rokubacteria bacterium]|nr:murein biosynthesis integral membrane protein MurJ [Candidatus Rokubacteria bacterium]
MPRENGEELLSPPLASPEQGVVRAAGVVSLATLASRVLGFARDMVVAQAFGAGPITDAFFVAFRIPNLLRRLLAEGALSTAFIPVFTDYLTTRSRGEFLRMLRAVAGGMLLLLAAVTLLGTLLAPWIVRVMAPGFFAVPATGELAVRLTRLMFPYLFFVGLAALAMGILNAHRHFLAPALAPVMLNLAMIGAVLGLVPLFEEPIVGLAVGVLVGGLGQLVLQLPWLRRRGALFVPALAPGHPALRRIGLLMVPTVFGLAVTQLNIFVDTVIASVLGAGRVSWLYYADRVVEFPLGVFGIAIATAALPTMAEQAARRDPTALRRTLAFALRLGGFITLPATVGLLVLREPIVRVLFQRGEFTAQDTAATAWALGFYALGLSAFAGVKIGAQVFYALGDTRTPVKVGIAAMVLNSLLAVGLALFSPLAHGGLALASSGSATFHAGMLLWLLSRRLGPLRDPAWRPSLGRTGLATLILAAGLVAIWWVWPAHASRGLEALLLALVIVAAGLGYGGLHLWWRGEEMALLLDLLRRPRGGAISLRRDDGV